MEPITRDELFMAAAAGEYSGELPEPITRQEQYLKKIIEEIDGGGSVLPEQIDAAIEAYLNSHDADIVTEQELSDELSEYYNKADIDNALDSKADSADIPDVSDFVTTAALAEKQDALTAGDNISIETINGELTISATDTTYSDATQQAHGLMSTADKTKLDGITAAKMTAWDAAEQNVNADWNAESGDAQILNKPDLTVYALADDVTTALGGKVDKDTGRSLMTADEHTKLNGIETGAQVNTVTGVKGNAENDYRTGEINISPANIGLGNVDNTSDANKPISTATQTALDGKQNVLTFDNSPTENSDNPVKSGGVYSALAGKADAADIPDVSSFIDADVDNLANYYDKSAVDTMLNKLGSEIEAAATTKRYGVRWLAGNTAAVGTRLGDAVGMAAGVQIGETVNDNDFDSAYPWGSMRRCNGDWNTTTGLFEVACYEYDTYGVKNTAFKTDGSNGNVWVEIPLFWAKHIYDSEKEEKWISNAPGDGYYIPKKLQRSLGRGQNKTYIAAYRASDDGNGGLVSVSGAIPAYGSFNSFMTTYKAMGTGISGTTSEDEEIIDLLMDVEFATRDQQSVMLGETSRYWGGDRKAQISEENTNRIVVTNAHAANFNVGDLIGVGTSADNRNVFGAREITQISQYDTGNTAIEFGGTPVNIVAQTHCVTSFPNRTGQTDTLTSPSGTVKNDGLHDCRYRYIETPYGKQLDVVMDLLINSYKTYFCSDMHGGNYSNQLTNSYTPVGYENARENGYVRNMGFDERCPHIKNPVQVGTGASTSAGFAAYYASEAGLRVVWRGGLLSAGRAAGRSCSYCYYAPSDANANRGSRRSYTA